MVWGKKKKKATVWNERRVQMRWAQTEGKCFWKGNRWEEEKHRRLLISSLVLFLCCVCFMFPSSDWRDYRLCRFYVQVPLTQPNFTYFNRRQFPSFLSFFLLLLRKQTDLFSLPSHRPVLLPSFEKSQGDTVPFCLQFHFTTFFLTLAIFFEAQPWKIDWFILLVITTLQIAQEGTLVV